MDRLLSFITVLYQKLAEQASNFNFRNPYDASVAQKAPDWLRRGVARVFREESMAYEIDEQGGVHPLVDSEFQRNRHETLISLASSR